MKRQRWTLADWQARGFWQAPESPRGGCDWSECRDHPKRQSVIFLKEGTTIDTFMCSTDIDTLQRAMQRAERKRAVILCKSAFHPDACGDCPQAHSDY